MRAVATDEEWQAGCDSTLLIAERCEVDFAKQNLMPRFPVPDGETEESWLRSQFWLGMDRRYPGGYDEQRRSRAEYEIGVIAQMGFCSYFLVVADFIMWAKRNGIRVGPGRGSAAGSMVAYALGITDLDPIAHGLMFERFLNPERVSMPDIDIDFDERRRGDVIRYVTEKYGDDRVAQIITYGTIKAKAAVKDATRVLGFPYALGDRITKAFPPAVMGKDIPLSGVFDPAHPRYGEAGEIRALYEAETEVRQVLDTARGLEGLIRQAGVHAAGVIMSSEPIIDHIPVWKREADGAIITQFDYPACESLGLLKMDFLGLRNLTVLDDAVAGIKDNRGQEIVLETLPLDDKCTYELLARGDTLGIFQLDGGPMRALLRSMHADRFEDIAAVNALYRPGPMGANAHNEYADRKTGRKPVTPIHPELAEPLAEILDDTFGLLVYQEQVLATAQKLAGYTPGKADLLRKAMGKKKKEILDKEFEPFEAGHAGERLPGLRDQDDLGHPGPVLRLRLQPGARGLLRDGRVLDRLPEGQLPGRVHGRPAHLHRRRQGQVRAVPERVPPDGDQGAAAGRERVRGQLHPGRPATSGSAWPRSATSAPTWWRRSTRPGGPRARSPASPTSCARSRSRCATSGSSSRWSRRARSTPSATRARAWS